MKLKILDKQEGNLYATIDITDDTIKVDTRLIKNHYGYWKDNVRIFDIDDNIIEYINPDYLVYIDN